MRALTLLMVGLSAGLFLSAAPAGDKPAASERDQALAKLAPLIGGVWTNGDAKFPVEFRYQWALNKTAIRGTGTIGKGTKAETPVEATVGWDPAKKSLYYLDFHGGERIFYGTITPKGDELHYEFDTLVGPAAKFRSVAKFPDADTYAFEIFGQKEGQWAPIVKQTLKRSK
jgi:hypothetical protein